LTPQSGQGAEVTTPDKRGSSEVKWLNRKTVRNRLGVSELVLNALIRSKLLGYTLSGMVSDQAVISYEQFGTQW
jgi:hypothetical protein